MSTLRYCKKCKEIQLKWFTLETIYQRMMTTLDADGFEDYESLASQNECGDFEYNGEICLDCYSELFTGDCTEENAKRLIAYMNQVKIEVITFTGAIQVVEDRIPSEEEYKLLADQRLLK